MALISSFQIWCKDINSTYCVFLRYIVLDFTDVFDLFFIISIVRMKHELQIFGHFNPWSELKKEMSFFNQVDDLCTGLSTSFWYGSRASIIQLRKLQTFWNNWIFFFQLITCWVFGICLFLFALAIHTKYIKIYVCLILRGIIV